MAHVINNEACTSVLHYVRIVAMNDRNKHELSMYVAKQLKLTLAAVIYVYIDSEGQHNAVVHFLWLKYRGSSENSQF